MPNTCKCTLELFLNQGTYTYRYSVSGKNLPSIYYPLNITATNNPIHKYIKKNKALDTVILGLLRGLSDKGPACQCRRRRFNPWVRKIPWRRKWQFISAFLPGKSHGQRSLVGYSVWGHKRVGHDLVTKHHYHL